MDINDPERFIYFVGNIKIIQKLTIIFYDHEAKHSNETHGQDPPLHIMAKVDGKAFKRILIDEGSIINMISTIAYKNMSLPFSHIFAPIL